MSCSLCNIQKFVIITIVTFITYKFIVLISSYHLTALMYVCCIDICCTDICVCVNIGCCPVCWQGFLRGRHDGSTWWSGSTTLMGRDKKHDHTSEHNIPSIHHYYTIITGYFLIPNSWHRVIILQEGKL